jgi:hypothetical protein
MYSKRVLPVLSQFTYEYFEVFISQVHIWKDVFRRLQCYAGVTVGIIFLITKYTKLNEHIVIL